MKLLVTDADERAALALTRSLGRRDEVHVAGAGERSLAGRSRRAAAHHRVPSPLAEPGRFAEAVAGLCGRHALDAVVPVSDAAVEALLPARAALAPARLAAPEPEAWARLGDKGETAELARRAGLDVPESRTVASLDEARGAAAELGFPVFLKTRRSLVRAGAGGSRRPPVLRIDAAPALEAAWPGDGTPCLLQQAVGGHGVGVFVLRWAGRTRAAFAHRRLREKPPAGGASVLRESVALDPGLLARVEAVLEQVEHRGIAMAELRRDGERCWLIEFNARPWGSLQLAVDAGLDIPRLWIDALAGRPLEEPPGYRPGVRSRWLLGELDHALALARGATDTAGRSGLGAALSVLLRPVGGPCRWEVLRREDPAPFAHEARAWLRALAENRRSRAAPGRPAERPVL